MQKQCYLILIVVISFAPLSMAQTSLHNGTPVAVKVDQQRLQRIDRMIGAYIDSGWVKGAVGFIARDGAIVYNKAFGVANDNGAAMQTDAIFRIASQTKAITSTAVMMLFEEGKFLLDDPVSRYLPAFAHPQVLDQFNSKDSSYTTLPAKREITIRQLLTHTSGIDYTVIGSEKMRAIYAKADIPLVVGSENYQLATSMNRLAKLPLAHQPGEKFTYGLNTDVLGYLVEVISGMRLDQFLKQRIFDPLGMKDTYFYLPPAKYNRLVTVYTEDEQHHLQPYRENGKNLSYSYPVKNGTYYSGSAGLVSTIQDYAIFLQTMLNGGSYNGHRILARRTVELMTMNQVGDLWLGSNKFGLGFEVITEKGMGELGVSQGAFSWGGYFGTVYWADPQKHLVGLLYLQQVPLSHGEIHNKFKAMIYQALTD